MTDMGDPRGDAFLRAGLPSEGSAPAWLDALVEGRLIAALIEPVGALRREPVFAECEAVAPGRWAVAAAIESDADIARFVAAVRRAAAGGRAGVAISAGVLGAGGPIGDAPHDALRLCVALAGRRGLLVDPIVHAAVGGPAAIHAAGRLLTEARAPRWGRIAGLVAAAAAVVIAGFALLRPEAAPGRIYILGQPALERSAEPRFESIEVTIDGAPGQYASLIVRGVDGRFELPAPEAVNRQLTADQHAVRSRFESDDRPGETLFMAAFSAQPVPDLAARLEALNTAGARDLDALRARLTDVELVVAAPIEHRP